MCTVRRFADDHGFIRSTQRRHHRRYGYYGGGIENYGTVNLYGGTVTGNSAVYGGGIYSDGELHIKGHIIVENNQDFDIYLILNNQPDINNLNLYGWYAVTSSDTFSHPINITGDCNLILCYGVKLTCNKGILVSEGVTLNI